MKKRILIVDANPSKFSFTACLAEEYEINARRNGFDVEKLTLRDMEFDPVLHYGYARNQELEPDLKKAQEFLKWCDHMVLFSPVWWYSTPALLKGFFDRVFLPNFAFKVESSPKRKLNKLLLDKTATLIYTYGGPKYNMGKYFSDPFALQLKYGILYFCGFKNIKTYPLYDTIGFKNIGRRNDFLKKVSGLGKKGE
jgi:putative NADPH-quinone reductase